MAKGGLEFMTTAWGVTPQAQKTGTSPSWISTWSPNTYFKMSSMPMTDGSPMCSGAPCTLGMAPEICTAFTTWL